MFFVILPVVFVDPCCSITTLIFVPGPFPNFADNKKGVNDVFRTDYNPSKVESFSSYCFINGCEMISNFGCVGTVPYL